MRELVAISPQRTDIIIQEKTVVNTLATIQTQGSYFNDEMTFQINKNELLIKVKNVAKYWQMFEKQMV